MSIKLIPHPLASHEDRSKVLTSTDMKAVMSGEWLELWQIKTGRAQRENLQFAWKPRLGLETEKLHAWWHSHKTGDKVIAMPDGPMKGRDDVPEHWAASYDYAIDGAGEMLELKHSHARNDIPQAVTYYYDQLQWQMLINGQEQLRFSIICGNEEPVWAHVAADPDYQGKMRHMAQLFWQYVEEDEAPPASLPKDAGGGGSAKPTPVINGLKAYDYANNNEWADAAMDFVKAKILAEKLKPAEAKLRGLIPEDAASVGNGKVSFKRDARGAYRVSIDDDFEGQARREIERDQLLMANLASGGDA